MIEAIYTSDAPRILSPGDPPIFKHQVVEVDPDDPVVVSLLESGALKPTDKAKVPTRADLMKRAKKLGVEGHAKLDRNELAEAISHVEGEQRAAENAPDLEGGFRI
jgi:hypothetical protein